MGTTRLNRRGFLRAPLVSLVLLLSCGGNRPAPPSDILERGCRVGCHPHKAEVLWVNSSTEDTQCWCLPQGAPSYRFDPEDD